ncbi:MAG TPA: tetratricopeptide repeat protein [Rhodocyclaceae bacterium]|nr:tetratricopeptide repeat protein [Rhodocyclaceae bacterium]
MSLLLEALKRAERQKRDLTAEPAPPSVEPSSFPELTMELESRPPTEAPSAAEDGAAAAEEPAPAVAEMPGTADVAPLEFSPPEAPPATELAEAPVAPASPPPPLPSSLATPEQPERTGPSLESRASRTRLPAARKRRLILGSLALLTAVATAGTLLWLDQQSRAPAMSMAAGGPMPLEAAPPAAPVEATPPTEEFVPGKAPALPAAKAARAPPGKEPPTRPAVQRSATPTPEAGTSSLSIRRSQQTITIQAATAAGYAAMANGNLEAARDHYQAALKSDQRSRDALLGLAVAALREGRSEEAARRYDQLVSLDPRDPDANAGLALLRGAMDPVGYESRLRSLLGERGDNAALHHALGALLAQQHRWGEAQEAFFRAVTLAPRASDYHFNLAVSLDHLGQYSQARSYYRQALDLAAAASSTFSREAAQSRLAALEAQGR